MEEQEQPKAVKPRVPKPQAPDVPGGAEVDPKVNRNSLTGESSPAKAPKRATRQSRDQRQRSREASRATRQATPVAVRPVSVDETRTIELTLPTRLWERFDKHLERSRQDASAFLRRTLAPYLR